MTDLINRADAIEAIIAQRHKAELSDYNFALGLAEDAIRHLPSAETTCATCADRALCIMSAPDGRWKACKDYKPSAEAVQVVRCKNCRYYDKYPTWSACTYWSGDPYEQARVDDNDFCSRGERKGGEDE